MIPLLSVRMGGPTKQHYHRGGPGCCGKEIEIVKLENPRRQSTRCNILVCNSYRYRVHYTSISGETFFNTDCEVELVPYYTGLHMEVVALTGCLTYALGLATPPIVTAIYRRYDKWLRQSIRMEDTSNLIKDDKYPYKYPVFVSASLEAELGQLSMALERQLHIACGTADRQLVCSRDNITGGRRLYLEITSFLEESGMMVIVISDRYNECVWCEEELAQARMLHKPILIIKLGDVDETRMNPILREVMRNNTPITIDDEYNITPDWESVCNVILQLLPCRLDSNKTSILLHSLLRTCLMTYNVIRQQY